MIDVYDQEQHRYDVEPNIVDNVILIKSLAPLCTPLRQAPRFARRTNAQARIPTHSGYPR